MPEDWTCTTIGRLVLDHILEKPLDGNHGNIHPKSTDFVDFGIPFVMANNIRSGRIDFSTCVFLRKEHADSLQKGFSYSGDVLLTHKATIGQTAIVPILEQEYIMLTPQVTYYRISDTRKLFNHFLRHYFDSSAFQMAIASLSGGGTRAYIGITAQHALPIALPPTIAEQETIAEVLSDADALIESLERLIAKKRDIKQGALHELLTGKKRLPGFEVKHGYKQIEIGFIPEDWTVSLLPMICRFKGGKAHEQHVSNDGRYICVNSKFISTNGKIRKHSVINLSPANKNDILMVMSDLPNGKALAKAFLADHDNLYAVNQRVCSLTPYRDSSRYLFYALNRNPYFLKFDDGVNQTHLLNRVFAKCPIFMPPTFAEQEAIANILFDMDTEITELDQRLNKARQVKQGMMQQLLTGKIRLV